MVLAASWTHLPSGQDATYASIPPWSHMRLSRRRNLGLGTVHLPNDAPKGRPAFDRRVGHRTKVGALSQSEAKSSRRAWNATVGQFITWKRNEGRVGETWLVRMRWELLRVPTLLQRVTPEATITTPSGLQPDDIRALRRGLPWERATWGVHLSALRQFLRWTGNPCADQKSLWLLPTGEPSHRRWISKRQLLRLLQKARGPERVLVCLEGLNGLRRVEVLRLRSKDVLFDEGALRILGKGRYGGKWRTIPMHPATRAALANWLKNKESADLVLPLSRSGVDAILRRLALRSGFDMKLSKVSHHDLRRTFGRLSHRAGMSLVQLKNLYGHSSLDQTAGYIGLDRDEMREGLERFARSLTSPTPRNRL
jgi:integrase